MLELNKIYCMDCLEGMKQIEDNSVDLVLTDPPYGYSFMGKDWDKAVPSVEVWCECLRVLKPGGWCLVMSAPRQDVLSQMIVRLDKAGFNTGFTSIYWAYASGFPKAGNIGKMVDKRMGAEREVVGTKKHNPGWHKEHTINDDSWCGDVSGGVNITKPQSDEAKSLDGSYAGFQPKPAVEVILVCMKPLGEKTFVDQALANRKGVTWLDDCRIPYESEDDRSMRHLGKPRRDDNKIYGKSNTEINESNPQGRFPANLLVSDDVLNDGIERKSTGGLGDILVETKFGQTSNRVQKPFNYGDYGSFSRYFSLDAWDAGARDTFPFLIVPKASKAEKNKGLDEIQPTWTKHGHHLVPEELKKAPKKGNFHPTVKPLKLMRYLITLTTREQDIVLDPFIGSGTTGLAAYETGRRFIGFELDADYYRIAEARIKHAMMQTRLDNKREIKLECKHCKGDLEIRNPKGFCDHLHYPEYCEVCSKKGYKYTKDKE